MQAARAATAAEEHVAVTMDTKLNMSQQYVFIVNKVNHSLSYIRKGAWTADEWKLLFLLIW